MEVFNEKKKGKKGFGVKVEFYIMSLWLLFVLIFILTVNIPISFEKDAKFIGFKLLISTNFLPLISVVMVIIGLVLAKRIQHKWKGTSNPAHRIKTIRNKNYEYLTFLTTYIIPLVCIDLEDIRYVIVLAVLLVLIGFIFVKMNLYMGNPTLALLGYRLYQIEVEDKKTQGDFIIITKDRLAVGYDIEWIEMDKENWYVRSVQK